ncbi:3-mercaptopyruvate sulfurtransferase [Bradyrhizobium sp. 2TAF24]|uniref:3-mercaptopyruvate sulfurtransferase n=1 Tax=Bradyrhizobium sp. 2TAF24 TaxID=3233011 RepID=UPI003F8F6AA9
MTPTDDPLVSTEWLASRLDDPSIRILDATFKMPGVLPLPADDFLAAHLPGAAFFDVETVSDHASPLPHMYPDAAQFARDVGALGVSSDSLVVIYDAGGWVAAPRAWWMFLSFGHPNVRILDGGLQKWRAEGRPLQAGPASPQPGKFTARLDPAHVRSLAQMRDNLASHGEQVIDARARARFAGSVAEPRPGLRSGHIPGSLNLPYNELFDTATGTMKPIADLKALFTGAGLDLQRPVVTTCGSGVSAAVLTLALYRLGVRGTALYDGSWSEWGQAGGPPVATGAT